MGSASAKAARPSVDHPAQRIKKKRKSLYRKTLRSGGTNPHLELVNQDPDGVYKWVRRGDALRGVGNEDYFTQVLGYEVVVASDDPGAVRPRLGKVVPGSPIIKQDMILVVIHRDDHDLIEAEGIDGMGGQVRALEVDDLLGKARAGSGDSGFENPGVFEDAEDAVKASSRLHRRQETISPDGANL